MQAEKYLEFIDQTDINRPYQMILLVSIIYKNALKLQSTIIEHGHKMNLETIDVFRKEIGNMYFDIKGLKASIEN